GDALYAFKKKITNDPKYATLNWDSTLVNPCTWWHINCDKTDHVTRIDLGGSGLSGQLAPELGQLKYLQYLELYGNNFDGPIPKEIGNLSNLVSLDLYNNRLSGPIPETLGNLKKLMFFRIHFNKLTGPMPLAMANLTYLGVVSLGGGNDLCGPFTARCIDRTDPHKCTDDYHCPCRCGPTFSTPCDYTQIPIKTTCLCCGDQQT
ncbi:somatic embryogenesis receptor kinase 2, partial [Phtheirospermum japonicum]